MSMEKLTPEEREQELELLTRADCDELARTKDDAERHSELCVRIVERILAAEQNLGDTSAPGGPLNSK